ncbi:hypothetical protein BZG29_19770 [Janthinobacterium sp. LM6]|uniref:thioesterase II family protein n=1 Tax=Janthinobacterium sp. LM6 TaxID=1938606 RepID=UPI000983AA57|nr:alpha/beta fold hydrolase [Janthinobacterium sp. LM6]AQR70300.1 hypothetical protein BZG29_19770 [Janthinobacterium sp. LM6]
MTMLNGIFTPSPRPHASLRLFCLPYAGGSSSTYLNWQKNLDAHVELVCVEPPGRGTRFDEAPVDRVDRLVELLSAEMQSWLDRPFGIFGHSNGALVGFELARRLQEMGKSPAIFFASAKKAPSRLEEARLHLMSDADLIEELRISGDTPDEFFETPELIDLFLPPLRADFALSETYVYAPGPLLSGELVMLSGSDDETMTRQDRSAWSREFSGEQSWCEIPGGHFFIEESPRHVFDALNKSLSAFHVAPNVP